MVEKITEEQKISHMLVTLAKGVNVIYFTEFRHDRARITKLVKEAIQRHISNLYLEKVTEFALSLKDGATFMAISTENIQPTFGRENYDVFYSKGVSEMFMIVSTIKAIVAAGRTQRDNKKPSDSGSGESASGDPGRDTQCGCTSTPDS